MSYSKFDKIYEKLGILSNNNESSLLKNLTRKPKKEPRNMMPHTMASKMYATEQLDTLYLPTDGKYRYLLVIVDVASRKCDAEPMITRDTRATIKALEKIFKRGIIERPQRLEVDAGSEFKGEFEKHFKKFCKIFRKEVGRHRSQSVVEYKNQQIGKILNARMTAEEINNDNTSRHWVDIIPKVVKLVNEEFSYPVEKTDMKLPIKSDKYSENILPIGTKVRILLDNPIDYVKEKRLHGKFRTGDIRWTKNIGTITRIFLRPNQPVMYQIDNNNNVAYTKYQLQLVPKNELKPSTKGQVEHYAQEIISKRKVHGLMYYKVRFEDDDVVEMDGKQIREELPDLLKEFNKKNT